MIEQQYYTRARKGLSLEAEGYDTVAKTPLLKLGYIKKNIHPLCHYDIPAELQTRGETDESKYPPNFLIFPTHTGEMIVGQAVYKNKDFTGRYPTFFMHNYVLSEKEKRRYVKDPEKLFGITNFATSYRETSTSELATLAAVSYEGSNPYFQDKALLFAKIGMTDALFHKLMYATFVVASSKRKIFIALNVPIEELGEMAKALLYHLYMEMPWCITETLGICTYASRREAKKSIEITFLDRYTLCEEDRVTEDFVFDFVHKRFLNVERDVETEPYIKISAKYSRNKLIWDRFNKWVDLLRDESKEAINNELGYYNRVALLLDMRICLKERKGYDISSSNVRTGLMKYLLSRINSKISDEMKQELIELFEYSIVLTHLRISMGVLYTSDEVKALLHFKLVMNEGILEHEAHCIQILLALLERAAKEEQLAYIDNLLDEVKNYPSTYIHLYLAIYERPQLKEKIAYPMIDQMLETVETIEQLIEKVEELQLIEPILMQDNYYRDKVRGLFAGCLYAASNQVEFLLKVQKWCKQHPTLLCSELRRECERYFVRYANLEEVDSERALCALQFIEVYSEENYEMIRDYQRLKTDLSFMSPQKIKIHTKIQGLIKKFYKQQLSQNDFYMLLYAFLEYEENGVGPWLNLSKALVYLNAISPEVMLDFVIWTKGQKVYIQQQNFDEEVSEVILNLRYKGKKVSRSLIKSKLGQCSKTKILCKTILHAQRINLKHFNQFIWGHFKTKNIESQPQEVNLPSE